MSSRTRLPESIKRIYREVATCAPGAIIAGGAIRDTLNNVSVKDVDIFVDARHAQCFYDLFQQKPFRRMRGAKGDSIVTSGHSLNHQIPPAIPCAQPLSVGPNVSGKMHRVYSSSHTLDASSASEYASSGIIEVWETDAWNTEWDYPINVIFTEGAPIDYVTQRFDFGICKAWYDGYCIGLHGDYTNDINNKTITMVLSDQQLTGLYGSVVSGIAKLAGHASRLQQKYPTHQLIMPAV